MFPPWKRCPSFGRGSHPVLGILRGRVAATQQHETIAVIVRDRQQQGEDKMEASEKDIREAVQRDLIEHLETNQGSHIVYVGEEEFSFKWRDGKCTILDEEGEVFAQYRVVVERVS
jgi:hypothetical protein